MISQSNKTDYPLTNHSSSIICLFHFIGKTIVLRNQQQKYSHQQILFEKLNLKTIDSGEMRIDILRNCCQMISIQCSNLHCKIGFFRLKILKNQRHITTSFRASCEQKRRRNSHVVWHAEFPHVNLALLSRSNHFFNSLLECLIIAASNSIILQIKIFLIDTELHCCNKRK